MIYYVCGDSITSTTVEMRDITICVIVCILLCTPEPAFSQCLDPDPPIPNISTTIVTDCGTTFDLCMDFYNIENTKPDTFVMNVFANDSGLIDYCASDTIAGATTKHGKIIRLPNCQWAYIPGPTFTNAVIDSFDYGLVINDSCINDPDYCDAGNGKFWTIYSRYEGALPVTELTVTSKKGNGSENVSLTIPGGTPIQNGDYFFADGTQLSTGQSNWTFHFTYQGGGTEDVSVHTSCSAPILGLTHPAVNQNGAWVSIGNVMTPVSGCVATNGNQANCNTSPQHFNRSQIKTRAEVTTQFVDTTRVYIVSNNTILPIEFGGFRVESKKNDNHVTWNIRSVTGEDKLVLQKSYNGYQFFDLMVYDELARGNFDYKDSDIKKALNYYRLAVTNFEGDTRYSDIILNRRPGISRSLHIYPRPSYDDTTVSVDGADDGTEMTGIEVYDMSGRLVKLLDNVSSRSSIFSLSDISFHSGLYLLRVTLSDGDVLYDKLIKK